MRRHSQAAPAAPVTAQPPTGARPRLALAVATALALLLALAPAASAAGRAFELVSPADKGGDEVADTPNNASFVNPIASADGSRAVFLSTDAYPGSEANIFVNAYMAERDAADWRTSFLVPPVEPVFNIAAATYLGYSDDLRYGILLWQLRPKLTPDSPDGTPALIRRDLVSGESRNVVPGLPASSPSVSLEYAGAADDFSRIVVLVWSGGMLTPETPGSGELPLLYEWDEATDALSLVGHLPDNTVPATNVEIAHPPGTSGTSAQPFNPVSDDGSRVFYSMRPAGSAQLYVRIDGTTTKQASASQRTEPDPNGVKDASFQRAAADGSAVFFTTSGKLTDDATTGPNDEGSDLYRFDVDSGALTDITVDGTDAAGAEVQGVLGGAEDGSSLYFVAKGVLAAGATAGQNNLYRWDQNGGPAGSIEFIASGLNAVNWTNTFGVFNGRQPSRVTADGRYLLFESTVSYTGYPNEGKYEAFLYDASDGSLVCASCNPAGTPATADALAVGTGDFSLRARTLSEDGQQVFFHTTEQLVPGDNNAVDDTYEYDAASDQINLISSGTSEIPAPFTDASADGSDVFFTTRQQLVGIDVDDNVDLYDAKAGGGIAAQNPPAAAPPCVGSECRGPLATAPTAATPASSQQHGPGNRKPHRKKHKKKHHKQGKHGNGNRHGRR